jgi:hypothetical protein
MIPKYSHADLAEHAELVASASELGLGLERGLEPAPGLDKLDLSCQHISSGRISKTPTLLLLLLL